MGHKIYSGLSAALIGSSAIVMVQPQVAVSQTVDEQAIAAIAKESTVVINGQNPGSGVIISRKGNTYYVLTAKHVVATEDEYEIVASDGTKYPLNYSTVKKIPEIDLALIQFTSDKNYLVAQVGDSDKATEGNSVYISGWPHPGRAITQRIFQITSGKISGRPLESLEDGYGLVYTNITRSGMSGGSVLDANGVVIGIHGRADGEPIVNPETGESIAIKSGFNLGIPINSFRKFASQEGIDLHYLGDNFFEDEETVITGHSSIVFSVDISPDNETLASGSLDGTIKLWDLQTSQLLRTISAHSEGVTDIKFAPNGRTLASGGLENTIKLWDWQTGKLIRTLTGHSDNINSVAFSPDSQSLASTSDDGTVKIWNPNTGQLLHSFDHPSELLDLPPFYVAFSPDSQTVVASVGGYRHNVISLWDVQTGKLNSTITEFCNFESWSFSLSPVEQKIAADSCSQDKSLIKVWDTITGEVLYSIDIPDKDSPIALAINRNGQLLASVSPVGNINIWNLHTGKLLRNVSFPYIIHARSIAFSADGQTLAVSFYGGISVFRLTRH
jgi:WD40 repeat protein